MADPDFIPVALPSLGDAEIEGATRAIRSGWVTQGPEVAAFERELAAWVGAPHAVAVSSATTALHLALLVAGVQPGDEVITASHSFIATANAVRYCGATPVFVDVQPGTFNLEPSLVEAAIGPRTRAILCVHQLGMPCDLAAILAIGRARGVLVIEDAACAMGSEVRLGEAWERIGKPHADLCCFSFHPRKVLTTGDGGMVTTTRPEWDRRLRLLRQHGMDIPDATRHASSKVLVEAYVEVGFNYRLTDIQAAVGRAQLARLPPLLAERRALAARYHELLARVAGLGLPEEPAWARSNWQSYCVRLPERAEQLAVMQRMLDEKIATRRGVMCAHREPAYRNGVMRIVGPMVESERASDRCIMLPLFPGMTAAAQERVADALDRACR